MALLNLYSMDHIYSFNQSYWSLFIYFLTSHITKYSASIVCHISRSDYKNFVYILVFRFIVFVTYSFSFFFKLCYYLTKHKVRETEWAGSVRDSSCRKTKMAIGK